MGNPRDHAARDISSKFSIFLPLPQSHLKKHITMRHPVIGKVAKIYNKSELTSGFKTINQSST